MKLHVSCVCPPVPDRKFDFSCYDEDTYDMTGVDGETGFAYSDHPIGYGPTEFDAIVEFVRELLLRNDDAQEALATMEAAGRRAEYNLSLHVHTCQQCGKQLSDECDCEEGSKMEWCSARCKAAFDL